MDDLYLDALGITDEDDVAELKGSKKKKGKKIDDVDFMVRFLLDSVNVIQDLY
jgi:[histone H3]-lysine36 N-trimethyltransferase